MSLLLWTCKARQGPHHQGPIQNGIADESTGNNYAHDQPYDRHRAGRDGSFPEAGKLGVWTKADSVTLFDDFTYQPQ